VTYREDRSHMLNTRLIRTSPATERWSVEQCESKVGGVCERPATWRQAVHAGQRGTGRIMFHSNWCDEHAESIVQKRRREWLPAPDMAPLVAETP
jgi:hypothetical protein